MVYIAPSILSADFAYLADEIEEVEDAGADIIHIDVMDGHFVPNITFGPDVVASVAKCTSRPLDCHLMITEPWKYIEAFAAAGADMISVHAEVCKLDEILPKIKKLKCKAGIAINPLYPTKNIFPYLEIADFVLVMTVHAGFGGQELIQECIPKITELKTEITKRKLRTKIEVDGGINKTNVSRLIKEGAEIIVAGSAIFKQDNYQKAIDALRKSAGSPQSITKSP